MALLGLGNITRRRFAASSAAAIAAIALTACDDDNTKKTTGTPQVIKDDSSIIDVLKTYKEDAASAPAATATWTLPLGTVLFHSEGGYAAAMLAPASAVTPNTLGILSLASGGVATVLSEPKAGTGWTFFDVRCSKGAFAWVEMNYTTARWRLYGQAVSAGALTGEPVQLDEGDADFEPPQFSCYGASVFWLHMPLATGKKTSSSSHCYRWNVGDAKGVELLRSTGRFATPPRVSNDILTVTPRVNNEQGTFYGMTALNIANDKSNQVDQLVLPEAVRPFEAVYTGEAFAFSIESAYSSSGALGQMGTFVGREGGPFIYFSREPAAQIAFDGHRYLVKTQSAHYLIDTDKQVYTGISSPDRSLDFGDYPASEGGIKSFLTYATIRNAQGVPESVTARLFAI